MNSDAPRVWRGCRSGFSRDGLRLLLIIAPLFASADYQAGLDAYNAGDYATAMAEWKAEVAEEPSSDRLVFYRESLYGIAMLHWQGEGVPQDYAVSAVWLKQAADINHPGAQTKLGYLYSVGEGVPQNYEEAARYFRMAARQGDTDAQHNLGLMVEQGLVPPQEEAEVLPVEVPGSDYGEDWILRRNPEHYTIQVVALSAPDKLLAFIQDNPDWAPLAVYRQTRYEKPLWVLVQGDYPDVPSARAATAGFPADLVRKSDLWIRKFGMVQRLIE